MSLELDHFFILTEAGAPAASLLTDIGLNEGTANDHPGQGTSNRRFFFADSMLELLYIRDAKEAKEGSGCGLRLAERISGHAASPFGLIFRATNDSTFAHFPGWKYYPEYLDEGQYFCVGENSNQIDEPLCIQLSGTSSHSVRKSRKGRFNCVSEIRVCFPIKPTTTVLDHISQCEKLSLIPGKPHLMEIVFNGHKEQHSRDLRPSLPLIVRW